MLFVHTGALGDFLNAWPTLLALAERLRGQPCALAHLLAPAHAPLAGILDVPPASPSIRAAWPGAFSSRLPQALQGVRVIWPVLDNLPEVCPELDAVFLRAAPLTANAPAPPRERWLEGLRTAFEVPDNALESAVNAWRRLFPRARDASEKVALLFPGSGGKAKNWPLERFLAVAEELRGWGLAPRFVLGPVEAEQGLRVAGWPVEQPFGRPEGVLELARLLAGADLFVGNDSGPAHMAGMAGTPGVALFGPSDERVWAPLGLRLVCAPGVLGQASERRMTDIGVDEVLAALRAESANEREPGGA